MYKKRVYRRKRPAKRNYVRKAKTTAFRKSVKTVVNKVLSTKVETKILQQAGSLTGRALSSSTSASEWYASNVCLTPQGATLAAFTTSPYLILGNGVGQDQRIGDECKIKATYFNYQVIAKPYDATFNTVPAPQIVTLFFIKPKTRNQLGLTLDNIVSGANAIFFENQTNADSGLTGNLLDLLRKIDKDNYQVIATRQHKVGWAGNLNTSNQLSTLPNNDMPMYAKGKVKIPGYMWKVDRNDLYEKQNIYCFAYSLRADGTSVASSQIPIQINYNISVYYTDM